MQEKNTTKNTTQKREGQIIKRGKTYLVRIYLYQNADGKKSYYNATIKGTRKDAERHLTEYLQKKNTGTLRQKPSDKRFGEFIEDYFTNISNARRRNREIDLYKVKRYITPTLGHFKLKEISSLHIENLYKELRQKISERTGKPLSGTTRNHVHRILVNAIGYAIKRRLIIDNPLDGIIPPKVDTEEKHALTIDEVTRFLQVIDNQQSAQPKALLNRIGCMWHLAIETGLRPEEYFALKWSDIDFGNLENDISATLKVRRVVVRIENKNEWWFDEPKTAKSRRSIPLSNELVERLKSHRLNVDKWKINAKTWKDYDLVFPNNKGEPHYPDGIRQLFKKALEIAEIDTSRYSPYSCRHTCASLLLRANVHPKVVSERLGHSSITITLDTYSHCLPTMQESATQSITGMIYDKKKNNDILSSVIDFTEIAKTS